MRKKSKFTALMLSGMLFSTLAYGQQAALQVVNPTGAVRNEVIISVPWSTILKKMPADTATLVVSGAAGRQLPVQFETRGTDKVQNLLIQVSLRPKETLLLKLTAGKREPQPARTFARYVPERKDDFAWENDRVAFRMYGKALEGTTEDAQGVDVWAKRTAGLVINKWYSSGDYHTDHGEGLDYYSVGKTLGAGDIAPFVQGQIRYPKHYRRYQVLDNGPLRSTFRLEFDAWDVNGKPVTLTKTISIDAGSQLNRVEAAFSFDGAAVLPVAAGIALRQQAGTPPISGEKPGVVAYWEPEHGADGSLGVGVIALHPVKEVTRAEGQLLVVMEARSGQAVRYYQGAAWNKAGQIRSPQEWINYLNDFKMQLDHPLQVRLK